MARHGSELQVQGGDLLDPPDDSDHLAAHLQTVLKIQQLIAQFRNSFWVRFQEKRWYLIALLMGMVVLPLPVYLWQNNFLIAGISSAVMAIVGATVSYYVSRRSATVIAQQFQDSFASAIAIGKQQLLASQQQNKTRRIRKRETLQQHFDSQLEKLNRQWQEKQDSLQAYRAKRLSELQSLATKRGALLQQQFEAKEQNFRIDVSPPNQ